MDRYRKFFATHPAVPPNAPTTDPRAIRDFVGAFGGPSTPPSPLTGNLPTGPRYFDYTYGANANVVPRTEFPQIPNFGQLWDAYLSSPLMRVCVTFRTQQILSLSWNLKQREGSGFRVGKNSPSPGADELRRLFDRPDPQNGYCFEQWLRSILLEIFVTDALTIYPVKNRIGRVVGFMQIDGQCYSDDTEVLTRSGWKPFADAKIGEDGDEFATRNPETKAFEWQRANYKHDVEYSGKMIRFHSRSMDVLVSPNHRMLVNSKPKYAVVEPHGDEWIVTADELLRTATKNTRIPATSTWHCTAVAEMAFGDPAPSRSCVNCNRPRVVANERCEACWKFKRLHGRDISRGEMRFGRRRKTTRANTARAGKGSGPRPARLCMTGDDFARFMGMYLSEGCVVATGKPKTDSIYITQDPKSKGYEPFRQLLARLLGRECGHDGQSFHFKAKAFSDYLKTFGHAHEKYVPQNIKEMPPSQLALFFEFYLLGDGWKDGNRDCVGTSSKRMADDLQEIIQKLGCSSSITTEDPTKDSKGPGGRIIKKENKRTFYRLRVRMSQDSNFNTSEIDYSGRIYCVSVPNQTLYVRRNGKPAWSANTVKPLIDYARGGIPAPPTAAYVQYIKGSSFATFDSDTLIYRPFRPRPWCTYGESRVENILMTALIYQLYESWTADYFTQGNIPESVYLTDKDATDQWDAAKLRYWQSAIDEMAGINVARRRITIAPPFVKDAKVLKQFSFEKNLPDWLVRPLCIEWGVPAYLFVSETNRATAKEMNEALYDTPLRQDLMSVKRMMDELAEYSGYPELEFIWAKENDYSLENIQGLLALATPSPVDGSRIMSVNEFRQELGLGPSEGEESAIGGADDPNADGGAGDDTAAGDATAQPAAVPQQGQPATAAAKVVSIKTRTAPEYGKAKSKRFSGKNAALRARLSMGLAPIVSKRLRQKQDELMKDAIARARARGLKVKGVSNA